MFDCCLFIAGALFGVQDLEIESTVMPVQVDVVQDSPDFPRRVDAVVIGAWIIDAWIIGACAVYQSAKGGHSVADPA